MLSSIFIFIISLLVVIRSATVSTKYAAKIAESFNLSKYIVGFIIITVISALPETFIGINAALEGIPSFGLGVLFGSNIADLTFVFAIIILLAKRGIKIESTILKNKNIFPVLLLLPLILGLDGFFSRIDGLTLIIAGIIFYYFSLRQEVGGRVELLPKENRLSNVGKLMLSMAFLLAGSHFMVSSASDVATVLGVAPVFVGIFIVGLGTTMPELFFSLKSVLKNDDSMAVGDIMGTVLADATIVVGIIALIIPFSFPVKIIYISGVLMVFASILLLHFMKSGKTLTKKEGYLLLSFWALAIIIEYIFSI